MKEEPMPIGEDIGGFEEITQAVKVLLNQFPGLDEDEEVNFETFEDGNNLIFSNDSGALVYNEKEDVTGGVSQECRYPFYLVYRRTLTTERGKLIAYQFLDTFGKWLCKEPTVYEHTNPPAEYPKLSGGRKITRIRRNLIYGQDPAEDGTQDWVLPVIVEYTNEF